MPAQPEHPVVLESRPSPPMTMTLPADLAVRSVRDWLPDRAWMAPVAGLAAGGLLARLLFGEPHQQASGIGVGELMLFGAVALLVAGLVLRRRAKPPRVAAVAVAPPPRAEPPPAPPLDLDRGVHAIRRADRGFDPARFAGYAAMMFRDVEGARMARDAGRLRDRLTPEMHAELFAFCDGLRTAGRSVRFDEVDVRAETTEAWQDGDRDYVTAYVAGSMLSHTREDATGHVVEGSRTTPTAIGAFLTFTRPAGLNFWMLSIIQGT
jgi:predicted lipid-binding transport protein (Tim44 family)